MSDDLIRRKAVIEAVDRHTREDGTLDDDISVILEEVKTAFDKGKVIEKIKEIMNDESIRFVDQAVNRTIEIVKKGGIEFLH